ncbi:MAG: DNA adenine methylase [Deltaproteobacteria bacterium]|nr:DNA adenine methylase [Deltaproteobacteria bacterium]
MTHTQDRSINPTDWVARKPIVAYAGGKSNIAEFLTNRFPPHKLYVDLFCGGLSVTLAKPRATSSAEWINDKYHWVANFFTVLRDKPGEFVEFFENGFIIDAEVLYLLWAERLKEPIPLEDFPDVEKAVMFWMTQLQTFTGRNAAASASYKYQSGRYSGRHYRSLPFDRIFATHERLDGVQIFCRDFRQIIEMASRYDDSFIFQDPPYYGVSGGRDYLERFSWEDHEELATLNLRGNYKWMLTINVHDDILGLYEGEEGVYIREYNLRYTMNKSHVGTELMITNYDTEALLGPLFQFIQEDD